MTNLTTPIESKGSVWRAWCIPPNTVRSESHRSCADCWIKPSMGEQQGK